MSIDKTVKIKLLNEVDAVIIGLRPSEYTTFSDLFKLQAPNYFFNPKYKAKIWDGYIRFFTKAGKTYINLLPKIIPMLKDLGYNIELIDTRDNVKIQVPEIDENYLIDYGIILGQHQVDLVNAITRNNGGMIKAGTGAGKTICCWILHDLYYTHCGFETLIIVPTTDLVYQTVEEFSKFSADVGYWGDSKRKIDHPVVVSTWQTLMNQESFVGKYKHIIMDECHGGKNFSSQLAKILNEYADNCYVKTGMTGTFPVHPCDLRTLEIAMGDILYEVSAKELIDMNWLASMHLTLICLDEDLKPQYAKYKEGLPTGEKPLDYRKFKKALFPDFDSETKYLSKNVERNQFIAEFVTGKTRSMGNSVVLVNTRKQGELMEELIPGSKFIYGKDRSKVRKEMFKLFSTEDDVIMITTYGLAAIGLNIKRIFNLFMIDSGKSFIRVIQTIGRGLRRDYDKDSVGVYDIYSNLYYSSDHSRQRIQHYTNENHEINNRIKVKYK